MINGNHQYTASGKQKKPSKNQVLQIKTMWETIPESMVQKSFRKTGITNALDGTQDDEIAEEDQVTRMEVTQEGSDDIFGPNGDNKESEDFFGFNKEL